MIILSEIILYVLSLSVIVYCSYLLLLTHASSVEDVSVSRLAAQYSKVAQQFGFVTSSVLCAMECSADVMQVQV